MTKLKTIRFYCGIDLTHKERKLDYEQIDKARAQNPTCSPAQLAKIIPGMSDSQRKAIDNTLKLLAQYSETHTAKFLQTGWTGTQVLDRVLERTREIRARLPGPFGNKYIK